jgi:arsenate reductase
MISEAPYHVLFLCTGNSARSIMAEALVNHWGRGRFQGFSAGSQPRGVVHPLAIETLARHRVSAQGARSKSWDEFGQPGAPPMDFVLTVCDHAAREACPVWPGHPATAHWGIADPAAVQGDIDRQRRAFDRAFRALDARVKIFTSLPLDLLDQLAIKTHLDEIGRGPRAN